MLHPFPVLQKNLANIHSVQLGKTIKKGFDNFRLSIEHIISKNARLFLIDNSCLKAK